MAVSKYSKKKEVTMKVLEFISLPEQSLKIVMDAKTIMDPWRVSHLRAEKFRKLFPDADKYLDAIEQSFPFLVPDPVIPAADEYQRKLSFEITEALAKRKSPKEALDSAAAEWEKITDRLVSLHDPDARPVRRGKPANPNEFGYVVQLTEVTANTRRGARGCCCPQAGGRLNPREHPAPRHRRRAGSSGDHGAGGGGGRRVPQGPDRTGPGRQGRDIGGGVYQITVPRAEAITGMGQPLLPAMGVVTVMNFQPTADGKAAITGDFVLIDKEVNAVAKTLRQHGIDVTALHNHGLMDTPRLFYIHFWANDDPARLAQGLKAALDQTNSVKAK